MWCSSVVVPPSFPVPLAASMLARAIARRQVLASCFALERRWLHAHSREGTTSGGVVTKMHRSHKMVALLKLERIERALVHRFSDAIVILERKQPTWRRRHRDNDNDDRSDACQQEHSRSCLLAPTARSRSTAAAAALRVAHSSIRTNSTDTHNDGNDNDAVDAAPAVARASGGVRHRCLHTRDVPHSHQDATHLHRRPQVAILL